MVGIFSSFMLMVKLFVTPFVYSYLRSNNATTYDAHRHVLCFLQADTLQKQMDQNIDEFKAKELDRSEQKEKLTSVVETLLRQVRRLGHGP